jgi:hypothetical protein
MSNINWKDINWEKIGVYIAILIGFFTLMTYMMQTRERLSKIEGIMEEMRRI